MWRALLVATVAVLCATCAHGRDVKEVFSSYLGFEVCRPHSFVRPASVVELAGVIRQANIAGRRVKAVGARRSTTDIICTEGVAVDMSGIDTITISKKTKTVTVGAGATLKALQEALSKKGLSLLLPPAKYTGITVGGALATGSHASSLKHPASIADAVTKLTMFDSRGELVELSGEQVRFAAVNLGVLGVVVQVTLTVVDEYKIRVENVATNDKLLLNNKKLTKMANEHDVFQLGWFPSLNKLVMTQGTFLKSSKKGTDHVDFGFETNKWTSGFVKSVEQAQKKKNMKAICDMEESSFKSLSLGEPGLLPYVNDDGEYKNPAVGFASDMLTQFCKPGTCSWDYSGPKYLSQQLTVAIPLDKVSEAAARIKEILEQRPACFTTSSGISILFHRASKNYLSIAEGVDTAVFEILIPLRQSSSKPRLGLDTIQLLQQTLLSKEFGGRPHWGSNTRSAFSDPFPDPKALYPKFIEFAKMKKALDPIGMFDNTFFRRLTRVDVLAKDKGCAVNEKCICSQDSHCAKKQKCLQVPAGTFKGGICVDK